MVYSYSCLLDFGFGSGLGLFACILILVTCLGFGLLWWIEWFGRFGVTFARVAFFGV